MGGLWAEVKEGGPGWGGGVLAAVMGVQMGPPQSGEQLLCLWGGLQLQGECHTWGHCPPWGALEHLSPPKFPFFTPN